MIMDYRLCQFKREREREEKKFPERKSRNGKVNNLWYSFFYTIRMCENKDISALKIKTAPSYVRVSEQQTLENII